MFNLFNRKKPSPEIQEAAKARKLLRRLFRLNVVKFVLIFILLILIAPFVIFFIYRPTVQKNINYGVTFSKKYCDDMGLDWKQVYMSMLEDLKVKNLRLVAYWDDIEAVRGQPVYDDIIWQLDQADKHNANVILSLGRKVPRYPECFEPKWWKELGDEDAQTDALLKHVRTTVNKLKDHKSIKIWQVENEPFFKFGECYPQLTKEVLKQEIDITRSIDNRPILVQDSGEGGFWFPSYQMGDYLGISMYRKVWYDFWHVFFGNFIYFKYPLAHWTYKIKSELTLVPHEKIIVTELQAEPWGPGLNSKLTTEEKDKTMSRHDFLDTINYAQKAGFKDLYFWGVEWWYWEKYVNNNPFYWDTAKALFN